jgi:DNA invertase Pin-like site-specific DNA recombinase
MSQTILYARVSTLEQNIEHQRAQAESAGFKIDKVVADHSSGISTMLSEREQGRRLFDMLRPGDTLVVRWIDRLGRNYRDVTDAVRHFMADGVIIRTVINNMTFDGATTDPMQCAVRDSLIAFMAAMAQAQEEVKKSAQLAGIAAAKGRENKYRGRKPSYTREQFEAVLASIEMQEPPTPAARRIGISRQAYYRIMGDPTAAERALIMWQA